MSIKPSTASRALSALRTNIGRKPTDAVVCDCGARLGRAAARRHAIAPACLVRVDTASRAPRQHFACLKCGERMSPAQERGHKCSPLIRDPKTAGRQQINRKRSNRK